MPNPNTNLTLRNRGINTLTTTNGMRTVYIGKNMQPIVLSQLKSVNSHSWQKAACFNSLFNSVSSLIGAHSVVDIISLVANELPLDSISSFMLLYNASSISNSNV